VPADRRSRLARLSRAAALACVVLAALPFVAAPAAWFSDALLRAAALPGGGPLPSAGFRALGAAATLVPACALAWGLLRLRRFFRRLAAGDVLSPAGARDLRAFGAALLARSALQPLAGGAASVAATWERGPGARVLAIEVSDADLSGLLMAALVFAVAWALAEAAEVAEDQRLIV